MALCPPVGPGTAKVRVAAIWPVPAGWALWPWPVRGWLRRLVAEPARARRRLAIGWNPVRTSAASGVDRCERWAGPRATEDQPSATTGNVPRMGDADQRWPRLTFRPSAGPVPGLTCMSAVRCSPQSHVLPQTPRTESALPMTPPAALNVGVSINPSGARSHLALFTPVRHVVPTRSSLPPAGIEHDKR